MTDRAQDVAKTSGDSRVSSQASQLASKYQAASVNAKVNNNSDVRYITLLARTWAGGSIITLSHTSLMVN